ncbi:3-oxoacyl-[acyl-carrier-protein] synthase-3 [Lewinella aquimaris]|uniref:3-oxoacyl-[acyl-carrier-protein] synthase-3 n=1 Tax=Neolewinella aquimaris TaxID=1835722 RepID=A0A840EG54_9BACT|nr:ketoacyl-ACP synthase III [Neolewinella aquimaris]MBB4079896.1 3-oxoacyl-[acyl-carrier-protein] synthase-3 [Neolewinella aquimaris]
MRNAIITGTGAYAPERVVDNAYFNRLLGEDVDTWLRKNVEIYERRWAAPDESTADLCEAAGRQALANAGIAATDLDLLIVATDTPEFISPSTASVVQDRLGATAAGTFDVNTACAGFVTALDIGSKYIRSDDQYNRVLVIGGYAMSKYLNMQDKKTVTLFADGAGAVVLESSEEPGRGFLTSELRSQGQYNGWMGIYGGGTRQPVSCDAIASHDHQLQFVHRFPTELNPDTWSDMARRLSARIGTPPGEVDHYFITQINVNAIRATLDRLGVDPARAHTIMHYYGYTGSACIPMALHDAFEKGKVNRGDLVYFIGSGGGLAFASAAFRL